MLHSSLDRVWRQALKQLPVATRRAVFVVAASNGTGSASLGELLAGRAVSAVAGTGRTPGSGTDCGRRVRLCHPLFRSVVLDRTPLADRVQVYQALAEISEVSLRAWYLAAAAIGPDEAVAGALVTAAEDARRRSGYGASARAWRRAAELSVATHDRVIRMVEAANDAFLAGDTDPAVAWCEEALRDCRDPVLAADIKLILGRARAWLGDPHRSYDDLVQAAAMIRPLDSARAASLLAEATVPAGMAGHVRLMVEVAEQAEAVWQSAGISPDSGLISPKALAMVAEAFVLSGALDRAEHLLDLAEKTLLSADPVSEQQGIACLGRSLISMERYGRARGHLNAVIDTARHAGAPAILAVALGIRSDLGWWSGQWAAAYADAAESLQWAEETGQTASMGYSLVQLARIDAARGDRARCTSGWNGPTAKSNCAGWAVSPCTTRRLSDCARWAAATSRPRSTTWNAPGSSPGPKAWTTPTSCRSLATWPRRWPEPVNRLVPGDPRLACRTRGGYPPEVPARGGGARVRADQRRPRRGRLVVRRGAFGFRGPVDALRVRPDPAVPGRVAAAGTPSAAARDPLRQALVIFRSLGAQPWIARTATELAAAGVRGPLVTGPRAAPAAWTCSPRRSCRSRGPLAGA